MLPLAVPAAVLPALYPGHKYLFDLGTGKWSSGSLPWLTEKYSARGIDFDLIFGARAAGLRAQGQDPGLESGSLP